VSADRREGQKTERDLKPAPAVKRGKKKEGGDEKEEIIFVRTPCGLKLNVPELSTAKMWEKKGQKNKERPGRGFPPFSTWGEKEKKIRKGEAEKVLTNGGRPHC